MEAGRRGLTDPYRDERAHALRARYHSLFEAPELPVPVESIAEDLLGLHVEEAELDGVSGLLYPAERRVVLNATEARTRQRFTLAHELGHWVCQCLEGTTRPVYCRAEEVGVDPEAKALEREANVFAAELLMPPDAVDAVFAGTSDEVAAALGVSRQAAHWRLYSFGLLPAGPVALTEDRT